MFKDNFSRYEFKFPMTYHDMDCLIGDMKEYVAPDENANAEGYYTISSIYMDNDAKQCYYETINNDYFRQKVRLRVYGRKNDENATSFLEIKGKIDGLVVKRRVKMVLKDAMAFVDACVKKGYGFDLSDFKSSNPQILGEIRQVIVSKNLKNVNVVSYDRLPYVCRNDPDLRITFDFNIRTRGEDLDLTHGTYGKRTLPERLAILEVKTSKAIPYWLVKILGTYGYRNQTFSKYCSHYSPQKIMLADKSTGNIHDNGKDNMNNYNPDMKGDCKYEYISGILDLTF